MHCLLHHASDFSFQGVDPEQTLHLYGGYGGAILGFEVAPLKVVNLSFPVLLGVGEFEITDRPVRDSNNNNWGLVESSGFIVIEPGVQLQLNRLPMSYLQALFAAHSLLVSLTVIKKTSGASAEAFMLELLFSSSCRFCCNISCCFFGGQKHFQTLPCYSIAAPAHIQPTPPHPVPSPTGVHFGSDRS